MLSNFQNIISALFEINNWKKYYFEMFWVILTIVQGGKLKIMYHMRGHICYRDETTQPAERTYYVSLVFPP